MDPVQDVTITSDFTAASAPPTDSPVAAAVAVSSTDNSAAAAPAATPSPLYPTPTPTPDEQQDCDCADEKERYSRVIADRCTLLSAQANLIEKMLQLQQLDEKDRRDLQPIQELLHDVHSLELHRQLLDKLQMQSELNLTDEEKEMLYVLLDFVQRVLQGLKKAHTTEPILTRNKPKTSHKDYVCCNCRTRTTTIWRRGKNGKIECNPCFFYAKANNRPRPFLKVKSVLIKRRKRPISSHANSVCNNCGTRQTSIWRRNDEGDVECNPCNLYAKNHNRPRPLNMTNNQILRRNRKVKPVLNMSGLNNPTIL